MMVCKIILYFSQCISILKKVIDSTDNTVYVHYWQSKGLSDGKINSRNTSSSNDEAPILEYESAGIRSKFKRDFLRQNKLIYNHEIIVNIIYEISSIFTSQNSFTLKNYLFDAVKITKDTHISKSKYSGYDIGFDPKGSFFHADGTYGVNVIIFGANLNCFKHANNRFHKILVLVEDFIQVINGTTVYAEQCIHLTLLCMVKRSV